MNLKFILLQLFFVNFSFNLYATDNSTPSVPVNHCYHWIKVQYLSGKYDYAQNNQGALSFENSNGVEGPGLYCAKTPLDSMTYGERLIRIDFKEDVVFLDKAGTGQNVCGLVAGLISEEECKKKTPDVIFYDASSGWYVIKNPNVVRKWTSTSDLLKQEMEESKERADSSQIAKLAGVDRQISDEVRIQGQKSFVNKKSKSYLNQLAENGSNRTAVPPLVALNFISHNSTLPADIPDLDTHFEYFLSQALKDPRDFYKNTKSLFDDIDLAKYAKMKSFFQQIDFNHLENYNTATLLTFAKALQIPLNESQTDQLWRSVFADPKKAAQLESFSCNDKIQVAIDDSTIEEVENGAELMEGLSNIEEKVDSLNDSMNALISASFVKNFPNEERFAAVLNSENIAGYFNLLNECVGTSTRHSPISNYYKILFRAMIYSHKIYPSKLLYRNIKNRTMSKESLVKDVIAESATHHFQNVNPVNTSMLLEETRPQWGDQEYLEFTKTLTQVPISSEMLKSPDFLNFIINIATILPINYNLDLILTQLVQQAEQDSINEGKNKEFVQLVSSDLPQLLNDLFKNNNYSLNSEKKRVQNNIVQVFLNLATWLNTKKYNAWAYMYLEHFLTLKINAVEIRFYNYPLVTELFSSKSSEHEQLIEEIISQQFDYKMYDFLLNLAANTSSRERAAKYLPILNKQLDYLNSRQLSTDLESREYGLMNSTETGRNPSYKNFCALMDSIRNSKISIRKPEADKVSRFITRSKDLTVRYCK